jgi:hypothetical protein
VTFEKGQTEKTLTRTASLAIAPEADPYLAVGFVTSKPNAVAAPETRFDIARSVPLTIIEVSVTVQPRTANCRPHAFGFAAILAAPTRNVGGEVRYSWWFRTGGSQPGSVIFAPGQTTQTVVAAQAYNIQRSMALLSASAGADAERASAAQLATSQATASPTSRREPAPSPTLAPQPDGDVTAMAVGWPWRCVWRLLRDVAKCHLGRRLGDSILLKAPFEQDDDSWLRLDCLAGVMYAAVVGAR